MNNISVYAKNTGMIIIGGGLIKHHICNANLMVSVGFSKLRFKIMQFSWLVFLKLIVPIIIETVVSWKCKIFSWDLISQVFSL